MFRFTVTSGLFLLGACVQAGQVPAEPSGTSPPGSITAQAKTDDELLLVDVLCEHRRTGSTLSAYQNAEGQRFLPLRGLSNAIGFRLSFEPAKKAIKGFLSSPSDRFELNGILGKAKRNGVESVFDPQLCFERDGDLYLEAEAVSRLTGLSFRWRVQRLELEVESDKPLFAHRQEVARMLASSNKAPPEEPRSETLRAPYRLWSPPSLDVQLYSTFDEDDEISKRSTRLSLDGVGDFLYSSARYRLTADSDGSPRVLLTLGRTDPEARLFGPLRAREAVVGDLNLPAVPLLSRARSARGAMITNFPLPGSGDESDVQLEGHAPAGALIELYRGEAMLKAARADSDGRYSFYGIPLEPGPNEVRILIVTSDGEIREERRTLFGNAAGPKRGEGRYRITLAETGRSLLQDKPLGGSSLGRREVLGEYQRGLSGGSWLSLTAADFRGGSIDSRSLSVGLHAWKDSTLWNLRAVSTDSGESAISAGLARKMGNSTLSLDWTAIGGEHRGVILPEFGGSDATSVTRLRLDGTAGSRSNPLSYGLNLDRIEGHHPSTYLRSRVSVGGRSLFFSNNISARFAGSSSEASGQFQLRRQLGTSSALLEVGYGLIGRAPLQLARLSYDRRLSSDYRMRVGFELDKSRSTPLAAIGTIYRSFGPVSLGLHLSADSKGGLKAGLLLSTGLAPSEFGGMGLTRIGSSDAASVTARAYLDKNLSGSFDEGDELLPNQGFLVSGRQTKYRTNSNGLCKVERLLANRDLTIALNEGLFQDPYWISAQKEVRLIPRPGADLRVDFAVVEAAELEGQATAFEGDLTAYPGMMAELVDASGKVTQSSLLDSTGAYVFSRIYPQEYILQITDMSGRRLASKPVKIGSGSSLKGFDVLVSVQAETSVQTVAASPKPVSQKTPKKQGSNLRRLPSNAFAWVEGL